MPGRNVQYFTEKEEEFTHLLIGIGFPRTVAKVLVFLGNTSEATSRDIERGADLRQPEVSIAMQYLHERGWIASRLVRTNSIGRPQNLISLSRPIAEIIDHIQTEKEGEIRKKMALTRKNPELRHPGVKRNIRRFFSAVPAVRPWFTGRLHALQNTAGLLPENRR